MIVDDTELKCVIPFDHQLSCTIIDYHQLIFILSLFKFFMIVHDFSRLTARMIVHDNFSVSCFPRKSAGSFEMAAMSSSRGSAAASEIRVYIQDDNHDKENIEDQDNMEKICLRKKRQLTRVRRDAAKKEQYH